MGFKLPGFRMKSEDSRVQDSRLTFGDLRFQVQGMGFTMKMVLGFCYSSPMQAKGESPNQSSPTLPLR